MCVNQQKDAYKRQPEFVIYINLKMEKISLSIMNINSTYCYLSTRGPDFPNSNNSLTNENELKILYLPFS